MKALKCILPDSKYPEDINEYLLWDDNRVLNCISGSDNDDVLSFKNRKIMSCVYESKPHAERSDDTVYGLILKILNNEYEGLVLDDKVDKAAHKFTPKLLSHEDDSGKGLLIYDEKTDSVSNIMDESLILESIVKSISINRIYADKSISEKVKEKIKDMLADI